MLSGYSPAKNCFNSKKPFFKSFNNFVVLKVFDFLDANE